MNNDYNITIRKNSYLLAIIERDKFLKLYLIRAESLGTPKNKGYEVYKDIFTNSVHCHITPSLNSVHYLATYHSLVRDAREGDLIIGGEIVDLEKLKFLVYSTKILHDCSLLQDLGIVENTQNSLSQNTDDTKNFTQQQKELIAAQDYILNLLKVQIFLSTQALIKNSTINFPTLNESQIAGLIQQLCWQSKIKIIDAKAPPESQLVSLFPKK